MNNPVRIAIVALILALGMVLSSALLSRLFVRIGIRHEQAITVKGYAEKDLVSDIGRFTCTCSARGPDLKDGYDKLQASRKVVLEYLKGRGFGDAQIAMGNIDTSKVKKRDAQQREMNEVEYYDLSQAISVVSGDVAAVRDVSTSITELIQQGIDVSACAPEFYVSDLKGAKLDLLAKATDDGYRRALALAENSRGKVGALTSAQQGVFQITGRNSTGTSGEGMYDTSTINKTAKAVVTLEYAIDANR